MITVKQAFDQYSAEKGLPTPTGKDYKHLGRLTITHFKRFWGPKQTPEIISQLGSVMQDGIIVFNYPDVFQPEMINRIEHFLQLKAERKLKVPKPKVKQTAQRPPRKRIPVKQSPAYIPTKNRPTGL